MASDEYNIETLVIAILADSATFSGVSIEHHAEDADTVSKGDRITVKCEPKTPMLERRKMTLAPAVWQAQVEVSMLASNSETTWDSWRDAVDAALTGAVPASVTTSADALFSHIYLESPSGGGQFNGPDKRRTLTRSLRAVFET